MKLEIQVQIAINDLPLKVSEMPGERHECSVHHSIGPASAHQEGSRQDLHLRPVWLLDKVGLA